MSVKIMGLVWDSDLPRNEKAILLAYADHADHEGGNVYPSVGRIAWKTGYKEREVQKITRQLELKGILAKEGQGPGGTNLFSIVIDLLPARPEFKGCKKDTPAKKTPLLKNAPPDVEKCTPPLLKNAPESSYNHPIKSSYNNDDDSLTILFNFFLASTKLKAPHSEIDSDKWFDALTEILDLANNNPTDAQELIRFAIKFIDGSKGKYTLKSPRSLVEIIEREAARVARADDKPAALPPSPDPAPVEPIPAYAADWQGAGRLLIGTFGQAAFDQIFSRCEALPRDNGTLRLGAPAALVEQVRRASKQVLQAINQVTMDKAYELEVITL